ncbi:hypothetical protein BHU16_05905 [Tannerella sp. oral taxon 808]|nr:hypothetical protein BHU16_05905 [Tannerella sp. oral taxon 808]
MVCIAMIIIGDKSLRSLCILNEGKGKNGIEWKMKNERRNEGKGRLIESNGCHGKKEPID